MEIEQVKLKGFRNYKNETINFCNKTLIIGANDVGKSNLLFALRIILDKTISEYALEPQDSDFFAYEETNEFSILIKFKDVCEDCIKSRLKGSISDKNELYLGYTAKRNPETHAKTYNFLIGSCEELLEKIEFRTYLRVLNLKYISSNRNLQSYIKKEKQNLLQEAREKREEGEEEEDNKGIKEIEINLHKINEDITRLSFIKNATNSINKELSDLSFHHIGHEAVFDVGASDTSSFIDNIQLASRVNGKTLILGGDGRNNQIFLALWAAKNQIQDINPLEVSIYCIEEPEAHLHPHQQRKLAEYLSRTLNGQVVITTHSPQITAEFSPNSIVRLYCSKIETKVANNGCAKIIESAFVEFGHRLNIIPAEAFFADVVFLVEGQSEVLFYKALAKELKIDLDKLNISILMVAGIGFGTYVKLLSALEIPWVLRTDNDIIPIPKKTEFRFAGIQRVLKIFKTQKITDKGMGKLIAGKEHLLKGFSENPPPKLNITASQEFGEELKKFNFFLSKKDLESDLLTSSLQTDFFKFLKVDNISDAIVIMGKRKATTMYHFLLENSECLAKLGSNEIILPLNLCKKIVEENTNV